MKTLRLLFACLILAFAPQSNASAQSILVDTSANWQQWISAILGGNCVEIENVTFNSLPGSASRFTSGQYLGLSEGIVLSSGFLDSSISNTPDHFLAGYLGNSSDSLIELYATQELGYTGNASSYDASRIEFDFTSPVNQTVAIRFVFASEEYPEFAPPNNSFFNDIFGFFVQEAGSNSIQNIALVPGTNLPVTIGNINAITNESFYLETAATDSFAFDGYTIPMDATFQVSAGVTYHMIIAIADIGDSAFDSAVFLEKAVNTNQSVLGTAYAGLQTLDSGYVSLYGFSIEPGAFPRLDSVDVAIGGAYEFQNVNEGLYLVQVTPDPSYTLSVPSYYPGVALWQDAQAISVACTDYSVDGTSLVINVGPGGISGIVGGNPQGGRLRADELIPAEGVHVLLQDSASSEWRGFDISNVDGIFQFDNLALGTYYVYPDVPGVAIITPRKVVIDELSPSVDDVNFQLTANGVLNLNESQALAPLIELGSSIEWTVTGSYHYFLGNNSRVRIGPDTLINDTLYHSFYADGILTAMDNYNENEAEFLGGFREDGSKLFMRFMHNSASTLYNRDLLYFDSEFDVDDTFTFPDFNGGISTLTILDRDTIDLNGVLRTRWLFGNINSFDDAFVMGIGNKSGLFNLGSSVLVDGIALLNICYTDNSDSTYFYQSLYNNVDMLTLNNCFLMTGGIEDHHATTFEVFPNPGNSFVTIKQDRQREGMFIVRDISGREHFKAQVKNQSESFQLDMIGSGLYILELQNTDGTSSFARWIKQ